MGFASQHKKTVVAFGELMLRLASGNGQRFRQAKSFERFFGGAEANTCVLLSQLHVNTRFVSALPSNELGQSAVEALHSYLVDTSFVVRNENRIGIYFTENGNGIRPTKVIYDRKHSAFSFLKKGDINWDKIFEGAGLFYWSGISPALSQQTADVCSEAIQKAKSNGVTIAADMNYRSTLWDYGKKPAEIMPELLSHCEIVTGDLDTIEIYFGIKTDKHLSPEEKFRQCITELKKHLPLMKTFAMSFRGTNQQGQPVYHGALMMNDQFYFSPVYNLPQVTERIGSGDAFQGGLLYGLLQKMTGDKIINYAIACGILKHSVEGDFSILNHNEVEHIIKHGAVSKVIR